MNTVFIPDFLLRGKGEKEEDAVDQMAEDVSSTAKLCK
jgi:hypothetical protein